MVCPQRVCWFDMMRLSAGTGVGEWSIHIVDAGLPILYSFAIHREGAEVEPPRAGLRHRLQHRTRPHGHQFLCLLLHFDGLNAYFRAIPPA